MIVWLILKIHKGTLEYKTRWFWLVFLCLSTHAILDSFTVYGTQLLWPLTEYPFAVSNIFIIDPFVTVPLLIGLIVALLPRINQIIKDRANSIGLVAICVYLGWSLVAKLTIDNKVETALTLKGIQPTRYMTTPAPFNTLLWRIVVIAEGKYYEIYASVFDSPSEVSVDEYRTNPELLTAVQSEWGVQRLQWFTKGLYSVRLQENDVVLSDLRMGVECAYVFNFKVAEQTESGLQAGSFEEFSQRPELDSLKYIWQRIWDPSISLAPKTDQQQSC